MSQHHAEKKQGLSYFTLHFFSLSFHWSLVIYVNSTYLEQFVTAKTVGVLYMLGTLLTLFAFLHATPLLSKFGNRQLTILLTIVEIGALFGMAFSDSLYIVMPLFILHQAVVPLILFTLDIFMEDLIGVKEDATGERRGLFLTITSLMGALASLGAGKLLGAGVPNFALVYILSAGFLLPFLYIIIKRFRGFKDPQYPSFQIIEGIKTFWRYKDVRNVFCAHFLLQLFFAFMVIYAPVYLSTVLNFNWEQIGQILFVGLMAYVCFEYLVGYVADVFIGEKEMMAFGFAVMAISVSWFAFLDSNTVLAWMIAMFITRIGASLVETTTESYFFKHTQSKDANVIGLFRVTQPLAYMTGAGLGVVVLAFLPYELLFVVLGFCMIPGLFFAMALHDTK
jgi:MFS family permease